MKVRPITITIAATVVLTGALLSRHRNGDALIRTTAVGAYPSAVAVDEVTRRAFVVNSGDNTVSVLDAETGALLTTVGVDLTPNTVVVDAKTARAFVVNARGEFGPSSVSVLNAGTGAVLRTIDVGQDASAAAVDTRTGRIFVVSAGDNTVSTLDAQSGDILRVTSVGIVPSAVVVDEAGDRVLVVNLDASISVLSAVTGQLLRTIRLPNLKPSPLVGQLALDETRGHAFLTLPARNSVMMLETATGRLLRSIRVDGHPLGVAVDERLGRAFMTDSAAATVSVIDTSSGTVLGAVAVGAHPGFVTIDSRAQRVFVLSGSSAGPADNSADTGWIDVLDARSGTVLNTLEAGIQPTTLTVAKQLERAFVLSNGGARRVPTIWSWIPPSLRRWLPQLPRQDSLTPALPSTIQVFDTSS